MVERQRLKAICDSYIKRTLSTRQFVLADFFSFMEPYFRKLGFRETTDSVTSILIIRLDDVGEAVITTGFLRELRRGYPEAKITLVVSPLTHPLLELCPYVDEVLRFASAPGTALSAVLEDAVMFCYRFLWLKPYSLAICPRWDTDLAWALLLAYMSGAKERLGYSEGVHPGKTSLNPGYDILLSRPVMNPPQFVHEAERTSPKA